MGKFGLNSHIGKQIINGTAWSGGGRIVSAGANFIANIILANSLSPYNYGLYFIGNITVIIMSGVGTMGMDQVVIRLIAKSGDVSQIYQWRACWRCLGVVVMATLPVAVIFFIVAPQLFSGLIHADGLVPFSLIITIWLVTATLQRQFAETYRGLGDIRSATLFGGVRNSGIVYSIFLCLAFLVMSCYGKMNLGSCIVASSLISLFVTLAACFHLLLRERRFMNEHKEEVAINHPSLNVRLLLSEGWPLWLAMLIMVFSNMGAPWIASMVDMPSRVALYGIAQRFMILLVAPLTIINAVMPPIFARLYEQKGLRQLELVVRSISGILMLPTALLFMIMLIFGREILSIVFGQYYVSSYLVLMILCAAQTINIATGSWQLLLPMAGKRHEAFHASVVAIFSQLGIAFLFGYFYGVIGVAAGYAIGVLITNLIGVFVTYKSCNILTVADLSLGNLRRVFHVLMVSGQKNARGNI